MLSETVRITSIEPGYIRLQPYNSGTCLSCSLKPSCGQYLLNSLYSNREIELPTSLVSKEMDLQALKNGTQAQLNIEAGYLVQSALLLYLLPLVAVLSTAFLAGLAGFSELTVVVLVFVVLFLSMITLRSHFQSNGYQEKVKLCLIPVNNKK